MDLSSLPEEMLASILKYKKFEEINRLRKINTYVNLVSKRNFLAKKSIKSMEVVYVSNHREWTVAIHKEPISPILSSYLSNPTSITFLYQTHKTELLEKLNEWMEKVTIRNYFKFIELKMNDLLADLIISNRTSFKTCEELVLHHVHISTSTEKMKKLLKVFPKVDKLCFYVEDESCKNLLDVEVLGNRHWLRIFLSVKQPINIGFLNDEYLVKVVRKTKYFTVNNNNPNFTFQGVMTMLADLQSRGSYDKFIDLGLIDAGKNTREEIERKVRTIGGGVNISTERYDQQTSYELIFKTSVDSFMGRYNLKFVFNDKDNAEEND